MRYRRPKGRTIYTLDRLLEKQPKALIKHRDYLQMMQHYRDNPSLKRLKINRRCYSLLNDAIIKPEHMADFYRTYRLPRDPFFSLFLQIKSQYINDREQRKKNRQISIQKDYRSLPPHIQKIFKLLKELEESTPGNSRLYRNLIPRTKKQINLWERYTHAEWIVFFREHLASLAAKYPTLGESTEELWAALVLELLPEIPTAAPDPKTVQAQFRKLSKRHHPDTGGDPELFIQLKRARDILINE